MNIDENYKRRIRIIGKPGETRGYAMSVYDANTGEGITNVTSIMVGLSASGENKAEVTYNEHDVQGKMVMRDNDVVEATLAVENPEIDVTAQEVVPPPGDWVSTLSLGQKMAIYDLREDVLRFIISKTERLYTRHPELKLEWQFQVEAHLRAEPNA
jgi:hypothetical protein